MVRLNACDMFVSLGCAATNFLSSTPLGLDDGSTPMLYLILIWFFCVSHLRSVFTSLFFIVSVVRWIVSAEDKDLVC